MPNCTLSPLRSKRLSRIKLTVRVILARDLEQSRESLRVPVYEGSDLLGQVLVDEEDANVLSFARVRLEGRLEIRYGRRGIGNGEVLAAVRRDFAYAGQEQTRGRVLVYDDGYQLPICGLRGNGHDERV